MAERGLQFTESERQYGEKSHVDKRTVNRRRQEKLTRSEVQETERASAGWNGQTGAGDRSVVRSSGESFPGESRISEASSSSDRSWILGESNSSNERSMLLESDSSEESRLRFQNRPFVENRASAETGTLTHEGSSNLQKAVQKRDPIKGAPDKARFREDPTKPPSKLTHRVETAAGNSMENIYHRVKELNRGERNPETSEQVTDTAEQGTKSVIGNGRFFPDRQEARTAHLAFFDEESRPSEPGRSRLRFSEEKDRVQPAGRKRTASALSAREKEELRVIEEVDRLKNPWAYETKKARTMQRRYIRKRYAAKARARRRRQEVAAFVRKSIRKAEKSMENTAKTAFVIRHPIITLTLILAIVITVACLGQVSYFTMFQGGITSLVTSTSFPSEDTEMLLAERIYSQMEKDLQFELDNYEDLHPNYDEYHFDLDPLGHDPYVLIALLTVKAEGAWEAESMRPYMEELFKKQYQLKEEVETEIRTREVEKKDPVTGEITTETEEYSYRILYVTLEAMDLSMATAELSDEQKGLYAAYMATHGNRPDLFNLVDYPNATPIGVPEYYDIPEEAMSNERFAAMIEEAEKYIGYPYVWGGSSPETSFDCSGFVSWVLNHTVRNVGRPTAEGLRNLCIAIPPEEARPGDLIFFQNTYSTTGASHVGIYVGNGMMLHCGNPIGYASIETPYWQSHFLQFGRI